MEVRHAVRCRRRVGGGGGGAMGQSQALGVIYDGAARRGCVCVTYTYDVPVSCASAAPKERPMKRRRRGGSREAAKEIISATHSDMPRCRMA